ncbi:MAG: ACT domain-containing protein [Opitutaceae bacterium]
MKTEHPTSAVIELLVRNHPGTMSHITGLFARRAFNLEAIICVPVGDGTSSSILLLVARSPRLEQMERQASKLHDVLAIRRREDLDPSVFRGVATLIGMSGAHAERSPAAIA